VNLSDENVCKKARGIIRRQALRGAPALHAAFTLLVPVYVALKAALETEWLVASRSGESIMVRIYSI